VAAGKAVPTAPPAVRSTVPPLKAETSPDGQKVALLEAS